MRKERARLSKKLTRPVGPPQALFAPPTLAELTVPDDDVTDAEMPTPDADTTQPLDDLGFDSLMDPDMSMASTVLPDWGSDAGDGSDYEDDGGTQDSTASAGAARGLLVCGPDEAGVSSAVNLACRELSYKLLEANAAVGRDTNGLTRLLGEAAQSRFSRRGDLMSFVAGSPASSPGHRKPLSTRPASQPKSSQKDKAPRRKVKQVRGQQSLASMFAPKRPTTPPVVELPKTGDTTIDVDSEVKLLSATRPAPARTSRPASTTSAVRTAIVIKDVGLRLPGDRGHLASVQTLISSSRVPVVVHSERPVSLDVMRRAVMCAPPTPAVGLHGAALWARVGMPAAVGHQLGKFTGSYTSLVVQSQWVCLPYVHGPGHIPVDLGLREGVEHALGAPSGEGQGAAEFVAHHRECDGVALSLAPADAKDYTQRMSQAPPGSMDMALFTDTLSWMDVVTRPPPTLPNPEAIRSVASIGERAAARATLPTLTSGIPHAGDGPELLRRQARHIHTVRASMGGGRVGWDAVLTSSVCATMTTHQGRTGRAVMHLPLLDTLAEELRNAWS